MATVEATTKATRETAELHSGDRMTREEFHRIYEQMPEDFKAELIGGVVYVASPMKRPHGRHHMPFSTVLFLYEAKTPGVECCDNTTVLLGVETEPQPDFFLRILPEYGGQSRETDDDYILGPPELVAEIAHSSHAIDLHSKKDDYARHGVLEYLVLSLRDKKLYWFDLANEEELSADAEGVCRLHTFPGLWIDSGALLARDPVKLLQSLEKGVATDEHTAFVERLAAAKR